LLINNWTWHAPTMDTAELTIEVARTVEIRVEHFELDGWAVLSLELRLLPPDDEMSGKAPDLSAASSEQSQERNPG